MSSPCRPAARLVLALAAGLAVAACDREARPARSSVESGPAEPPTTTDLYAGSPAPFPSDPRAKEYEGNAYHISQGQKYFRWFNCNGCHANGGGGMGPALIDDQWRYGSQMEQIYATIVQGRPNGMPSFRDKIPPEQVWQIAAYVRAMSGNADRLAAPSRGDTMSGPPPPNQTNPAPPKSDPMAATSTSR